MRLQSDRGSGNAMLREITVNTLDDLASLSESVDVECKLATGVDGKGQLPKDFWPTYSAFANTHGGLIMLGLREEHGRFAARGIKDVDRVVADLFNTVNNPQKVSVNLLTDAHIRRLIVDGRSVIAIEVPAASRKHKPVHLNGNPFRGNTYRRLHDGDRHCDDDTVRRMITEQVNDVRDLNILNGFSLADLDPESVHAYRNMLSSHKPDHPWTTLDDLSLLRALGGWRRERSSDEEGLTLAGLLMLGRWPAIHEAAPYYFVDYQERPAEGDENDDVRWLDRVVPDGTWSGNLFDFYRRVVRKIVADLKVPFALKGDIRQDDTPAHQALREAMVNMLVHADYADRASVLVVKQPSGFVFRNPGLLRVPATLALQGGESDCRNRTLQQMFLMIGLGERAGSGLTRIQRGWGESGGLLNLADSFEPYDQTRLDMDFSREGADSASRLAKMSGKMSGKVLALLKEMPELSIPEMATRLGKSQRTVERATRELRSAGKLTRIGPDKGGYWKVTDGK